MGLHVAQAGGQRTKYGMKQQQDSQTKGRKHCIDSVNFRLSASVQSLVVLQIADMYSATIISCEPLQDHSVSLKVITNLQVDISEPDRSCIHLPLVDVSLTFFTPISSRLSYPLLHHRSCLRTSQSYVSFKLPVHSSIDRALWQQSRISISVPMTNCNPSCLLCRSEMNMTASLNAQVDVIYFYSPPSTGFWPYTTNLFTVNEIEVVGCACTYDF